MLVFIKKIGLFCIASFAVVALLVLVPSYVIKSNTSFKLNNTDQKVVLGHSHPECAFNDSLISNFRNLASSGESYFYTFQKIKKVIPDNPQIKTVFIEFSNNQIDSVMNEWIWGFDKMSFSLPIYEPFMSKKDLLFLANHNSNDFMACMSIASKNNLYRSSQLNFDFTKELGGFTSLNEVISKELIDEGQGKINADSEDNIVISESNLQYLRKIIDFCRKNNQDVYLIRSPQHRNFHYLNNETKFQQIRRTRFSDVEFLDFGTFSLPDDHFADLGHLNNKGAQKFSLWFNDLLNDGLLQSENIDYVIKERME